MIWDKRFWKALWFGVLCLLLLPVIAILLVMSILCCIFIRPFTISFFIGVAIGRILGKFFTIEEIADILGVL